MQRRNGTSARSATEAPATGKSVPGRAESLPGDGGPAGVQRIERSITYMREHLDQPLPVAKLAALANVSPSHFFALFKRLTGSAPMDYFTHLRMQRACRLLDDTSASVKEVAAALGYDDPFYFSRVFKAINRVPPSRYRALQEQTSTVDGSIDAATEGEHFANGNGAVLAGNASTEKSRIIHSQ